MVFAHEPLSLNSQLSNVFPQLDGRNASEMIWLTPDTKISTLYRYFFGLPKPIRHIPIFEKQPGPLKALISLTDYVKFLVPPLKVLPLDLIDSSARDAIADCTKEICSKRIDEAFDFLFDTEKENPPRRTVTLSVTESLLKDALDKLINTQQYGGENRRYRTIPVFDNDALVGMLSYTDVLRKIKEHPGNERFTNLEVKEILKPKRIESLEGKATLDDAIFVFENNDFTHLPITKIGNSRVALGIVDDLTVRTYEHHLLIKTFSKLSLNRIDTKLGEKNTVRPDQKVSEVIDKFIDGKAVVKPTSLVVYTEERNGEYTVDNIVSYRDVFRAFQEFLSGGNLVVQDYNNLDNGLQF